jgi:flagella basal body P-ring formation protein FlgA
MQLLCHQSRSYPLLRMAAAWARWWAQRGLLWVALWAACGALAQAPADKLFAEVGQWVQQSQKLSASQFTFAPLDARVQVEACDRALVMDSPFAARETVRVRCLGKPGWQLYLRVVLKPGVAPGLPEPGVPGAALAAAAPAPVAPPQVRRVVVAKDVLRAGTVVSAARVRELDVVAQGLDPQALASVREAENAEVVRDIAAGVPLRSYDLRRAVLVKQGQSVVLTVGQGSGFSITARVEALQDGKMGDQIRLKNPDSGRSLSGVVTGPNAARGL